MRKLVTPVAGFNIDLKIIKLFSFNAQAFTFWLQHYCKFCLIFLFYNGIFANAI